jgi:hypothetical protein
MPLHVVVTAREKAIYDEVGNGAESKLEISDYVPDIERSAEYVFDLVLRFYLDGDKRKAKVYKSRFDAFPPGTIIEDPRWELFAPLAQVGGDAQGLMPDPIAAAEAEAAPEPAAWTRDPRRVTRARQWLAEQGLDDRDANAALGTDDWRTTHLEPDEFKTAITAYIARQVTGADSADDTPAETLTDPRPADEPVLPADAEKPARPAARRNGPVVERPDLRQVGAAIGQALQIMVDNDVEIAPAPGWERVVPRKRAKPAGDENVSTDGTGGGAR